MTAYPRFTINRHLLILGYRQPFLDWLLEVDPQPPGTITLESLREDAEAFLVPENAAETLEDAVRWVERRWRMFFEHILGQWLTDEALWPKECNLKMFRQWFDVQYHSLLWDLGTTPLLLEDWEEEEDDTEADDSHPETYH